MTKDKTKHDDPQSNDCIAPCGYRWVKTDAQTTKRASLLPPLRTERDLYPYYGAKREEPIKHIDLKYRRVHNPHIVDIIKRSVKFAITLMMKLKKHGNG